MGGEARTRSPHSNLYYYIAQNIEKCELEAIFKKVREGNCCFATRYLSRNR